MRHDPAERSAIHFHTDERGVTPAVSKSLEATIVVLFVGLLTASLFGGVVPEYRTAAGDEVADRTLAAAAHRVGDAIPPNATAVDARVRVELPVTIRDEAYRIRAEDRHLFLAHPHDSLGGRVGLALPSYVRSVTGEWYSRRPATVVVESVPGGLGVRLRQGTFRSLARPGSPPASRSVTASGTGKAGGDSR